MLTTDAVMNKILAMSGKATTQAEMAAHMKSLPNISKDHPAVSTYKAMQIKHMLDLRQVFDELRLGDHEIDKFYQTNAGNILGRMTKVTFDKMDQLRQLRSGDLKSMTIGTGANKKTYTYKENAAAEKAILNGMSRANLNLYVKRALKEAGILDAIPLD